jgi:AAA+ ATPase superfamily predicted ATPase
MAKNPSKNQEKIIGRVEEQEILGEILKSKRAEFLALYGRRRVGKTFLVRNFFEKSSDVFFHMTGIQKGTMEEQLRQFANQISITFYNGVAVAPSKNWFDTFHNLRKTIEQIDSSKKVVVFLDELPWLATRRSKLLQALEFYWNQYWSHDTRFKLIYDR